MQKYTLLSPTIKSIKRITFQANLTHFAAPYAINAHATILPWGEHTKCQHQQFGLTLGLENWMIYTS